jgi:uncharacterized protein
MTSKLLHDHGGQRTFALVFETGEEVMSGLTEFAKNHRLKASHFTAIGAFSDAIVAYFDWETRTYKPIPIREQVEVLTLAGDITWKDRSPQVHAHVVLGQLDATARGGHLMEAHVRPTLEVILIESPKHLERQMDPESGLPLIDLTVPEGSGGWKA